MGYIPVRTWLDKAIEIQNKFFSFAASKNATSLNE